MNVSLILILFPIVFIIHELEEIIMVEKWMGKHRDELFRRFPVVAKRLERITQIDTRSFAVIVVEEFLIVSGLTIMSIVTGNIIYWYCVLAAFSIHLLIHLLQFIVWKNYIPAIITTVLCIPYCILALYDTIRIITSSELILYAAIGIVVAGANLLAMHELLLKISSYDKR